MILATPGPQATNSVPLIFKCQTFSSQEDGSILLFECWEIPQHVLTRVVYGVWGDHKEMSKKNHDVEVH